LLYCCFTAALLLLYFCFTAALRHSLLPTQAAALLLLYCCFTADLLLLYFTRLRAEEVLIMLSRRFQARRRTRSTSPPSPFHPQLQRRRLVVLLAVGREARPVVVFLVVRDLYANELVD
jgi:hypothetical protein